jgi:Fis family transcriptional regulator
MKDKEHATEFTGGTPVQTCIEAELERYFAMLDGQSPVDLYKLVIGQAEQALLNYVLKQTEGNQSRASQYLGINRGTLRKKLREHALVDL